MRGRFLFQKQKGVIAMKAVWHGLQAFFVSVGGWLGWFMGGWDGFLYALVVFAVIDYLTGFMCAVVDRNLSSEIGAKGIFKKVVIFALVGVGHTIDMHLIGDGGVIRTAVIFFFASNEGVSLLENAARLGLPIPQKLKDILSQLHGGGNKKE
jgi:toxin secretion/phage lysis holin